MSRSCCCGTSTKTFPEGYGYSQFCHLFRAWQAKADVVMRQDHRAGEKAFCDFSGLRLPIYDTRSGALAFEAELYVCCLGASSFTYAEAVRTQGLADWIGASVHAVEYFGGAPAIWVPDNLRSAVTSANRYEPLVNVTFDEFAAHYGMAVIPARPYKPRDKAKVEAAVLMAERWILAVLRKQRFTSLAEANAAIELCLERLNDKPFKKLPGSRRSLHETLDRPALRPLRSRLRASPLAPGAHRRGLLRQHRHRSDHPPAEELSSSPVVQRYLVEPARR